MELTKHSVKQRETTVIGGGGKENMPSGSATELSISSNRFEDYHRWAISPYMFSSP